MVGTVRRKQQQYTARIQSPSPPAPSVAAASIWRWRKELREGIMNREKKRKRNVCVLYLCVCVCIGVLEYLCCCYSFFFTLPKIIVRLYACLMPVWCIYVVQCFTMSVIYSVDWRKQSLESIHVQAEMLFTEEKNAPLIRCNDENIWKSRNRKSRKKIKTRIGHT